MYELDDLPTLAFLSYLLGLEDNVGMSLFSVSKAGEFGLFSYTDRNPSADMFERLFTILRTDFLGKIIFYSERKVNHKYPDFIFA